MVASSLTLSKYWDIGEIT